MSPTSGFFDAVNTLPGTLVTAALETIQVFHFSGQIRSLAITVADNHPWTSRWQRMGTPIFHPSSTPDWETVPNTSQFLMHPKTLEFLHTLPDPVRILMFKPDARSAAFLKDHGFTVLGCDPGLARRLENKMVFPGIATEAGLNIPPTIHLTLPPRSVACPELPKPLPFIVQFAKGFSGNRTFLIQSAADWQKIHQRFAKRKCRVSAYVEGKTWTANGCVMPDGRIAVSAPFLQETHHYQLPETDLPTRIGSRGNIWGLPESSVTHTVTHAMHRLGNVLHKRGFTGFFGADFLNPSAETSLPGNPVNLLAIEINPRITASASILTPLEMHAGLIPIIGFHLAAMLNLGVDCSTLLPAEIPDSPGMIEPQANSLWTGGQWIIRSSAGDTSWISSIPAGIFPMQPQPGQVNHLATSFGDPSDPDVLAHIPLDHCLVWKPGQYTATRERCRLIYRGDPQVFYGFLHNLQMSNRNRNPSAQT